MFRKDDSLVASTAAFSKVDVFIIFLRIGKT